MENDILIYKYKDKLYGLCMHLEKDTYYAEELFQDTWVKVLDKLHTYDSQYEFYPWLSKIAVNLYRDRLRKLKIELKNTLWGSGEEVINKQDLGVDIENTIIQKQDVQLMNTCLQKLEGKYRLPIILCIFNELSYKQIADILGIKETTVKSRIYEGRQKLKQLLSKEEKYGR